MTLVKGTIYNEASFFGKNFCSSEVTTKDFCALLSMSYKNLAHKIILMPGDFCQLFPKHKVRFSSSATTSNVRGAEGQRLQQHVINHGGVEGKGRSAVAACSLSCGDQLEVARVQTPVSQCCPAPTHPFPAPAFFHQAILPPCCRVGVHGLQ